MEDFLYTPVGMGALYNSMTCSVSVKLWIQSVHLAGGETALSYRWENIIWNYSSSSMENGGGSRGKREKKVDLFTNTQGKRTANSHYAWTFSEVMQVK